MLHVKTISSKDKKIQKLTPFGIFVIEALIFAAANTFFSWIWYLSQTVAPVFVLNSFENTS